MKFVLATQNPGKVREMQALFGAAGIEILPLAADAPDPIEDGASFEENALIKARSAAAFMGLPAIADDSGLCVDALGGRPGIYSARYGAVPAADDDLAVGLQPLGVHATDKERTLRLLRNLATVPDGKRQAQFVCAMACVFPEDQREPIVVRGECAGEIIRRPCGAGGFGYDPVFYVPAHACTFGELPSAVKNEISHRGRAAAALCERIRTLEPFQNNTILGE